MVLLLLLLLLVLSYTGSLPPVCEYGEKTGKEEYQESNPRDNNDNDGEGVDPVVAATVTSLIVPFVA